ncbi:MAG: urease accessory protein UreH domain-containing protein [Promethearchaeota archaeon]
MGLNMETLQIYLIFWPGFFWGILHTLMPCEDKTIFFFYTFGVSRDSKEAFKILNMYALGLLSMNMIIGTMASIFGGIIFAKFSPLFNNALGALSIIISGIYMFIQVIRKRFSPHSHQKDEIIETFNQRAGRFKKRTSFLLGILAGIPPCIFEISIYSSAVAYSASAGIINGIGLVLFYGLGTWLGFIPLMLFGLIGPFARNYLNNRQRKKNHQKSLNATAANISKYEDEIEPYYSEEEGNTDSTEQGIDYGKIIEIISSLTMVLIGIILFILALLGINIFKGLVPKV